MIGNDKQEGGNHYLSMGIQPINYMAANFTKEQFEGYCLGNILKYVSRYGKKGVKREQLMKARQYIDFLIARLDA